VWSGTGRINSPAWTLNQGESARAGRYGVAVKLPDMLGTESERTLAAVRHRLGRNAFHFLCEDRLGSGVPSQVRPHLLCPPNG
jgi:hypothetical protein